MIPAEITYLRSARQRVLVLYLTDMSRRGLALPFAMFFTGLIFCLCTVMATEALTNLRLTSMEAEQTRQAAAARGAVAQAVYRMNINPGWAEAHLTTRQRDEEDGLVIYTWTSKKPEQPHIYHVHARVESAGSSTVFQEAHGTVRKGDDVSGVAYAQTPGYSNGPDAIDTGFILREDHWEPAPLATAYYYEGGSLHTSDEPPRNMPAGCMDPHGNTYVVLHPLWDGLVNNPFTRGLMVRIIDQSTERASVWQLYSLLHNVSEFSLFLPGPRPAIVRVSEAGVSTVLPPLPGYELDSNGRPVPNSGLKGLTWQPSCDGHTLYITNLRAGGDILYRCEGVDTDHPSWSAIGPPPRSELTDPLLRPSTEEGYAPLLGSVTQDQYGTVYALWGEWRGETPTSGIFRLDGDHWTALPPPPEVYYDAEGGLHRNLTRKADSFCSMRSGPGGELYGLWFPGGRSQLLKYSGGVWNAVRPPRESMANGLDVDADGKLLVKYPLPGQPDELYRIVDGEARLLPKVPGDYRQVGTGAVIEREGVDAQTIMAFAGGGRRKSDNPRFFTVASY